MIQPRHHWLITNFFSYYITYIVKRNFHSVNFNKVGLDPAKAVLLIANHTSWWDGFLLFYINRIYFKKRFKIMVLHDTMKQVWFFKYLGAFSVAKNSKQITGSLAYASQLLNNPQNMVVIFPQGRLYSNFVDDVKFEKGLFKIIQQATSGFQYLFAAQFTENFSHKKPSVNLSFKVIPGNDIVAGDVQSAYQQHYSLSKLHQTQIVI